MPAQPLMKEEDDRAGYRPHQVKYERPVDAMKLSSWGEQSSQPHWMYGKISIWKGSATMLKTQVLVNSSSEIRGQVTLQSEVRNAVGKETLQEMENLHPCVKGEPRISRSADMQSEWLIHTACSPLRGEDELAQYFMETLKAASNLEFKTIVYPDTQLFESRRAQLAINVIMGWLYLKGEVRSPDRIVLCVGTEEQEAQYHRILRDYMPLLVQLQRYRSRHETPPNYEDVKEYSTMPERERKPAKEIQQRDEAQQRAINGKERRKSPVPRSKIGNTDSLAYSIPSRDQSRKGKECNEEGSENRRPEREV